jgi:hypothetical protein
MSATGGSWRKEPTFVGPAWVHLVELVRNGKFILFVGAGVHYPPPPELQAQYTYPEPDRPPLGSELARTLAPKCAFGTTCPGESDSSLQRVSLCFERSEGLGRQLLVDEVREAVNGKTRPSATVRGLAALPFKFVMTTNYDSLFERALAPDKEAIKRVYDPSWDRPTKDFPGDVVDVEPRRPWLFKIHGDADDPESIVITDEDYINFVHRMTSFGSDYPIPNSLHYLLGVRPILFVGYGLLDFNLRLLFHTLRWRLDGVSVPPSFSVDIRPDPLVSQVWSAQLGLSFIVEDVWSFVPRLYREVLGEDMPA